MRQFYNLFPKHHALRDALSWTHYRLLLKVNDEKARAFYIEETILTYGGEPISETAACTYDRDIGPMGFEEAGNRIEAYTSLHFDDASESGELLIDEISTKVFSIGAMTFNLNNPPLLQIGFDDTLDIYMNGECSGPYFEASENPVNKHIKTCTSLGFTKGTEKHGDCVMKLLG